MSVRQRSRCDAKLAEEVTTADVNDTASWYSDVTNLGADRGVCCEAGCLVFGFSLASTRLAVNNKALLHKAASSGSITVINVFPNAEPPETVFNGTKALFHLRELELFSLF